MVNFGRQHSDIKGNTVEVISADYVKIHNQSGIEIVRALYLKRLGIVCKIFHAEMFVELTQIKFFN